MRVRILILVAVACAVIASAATASTTQQQSISSMTYAQLDRAAQKEIARGGIYSMRWGHASSYLRSLCYEMLDRKFSAFGTQAWARFIVNRESGCNPGAVNTTYSSWDQRAQGLAQLIPYYHRWVNYPRMLRNVNYAIQVFVHLSHGGSYRGPWGT